MVWIPYKQSISVFVIRLAVATNAILLNRRIDRRSEPIIENNAPEIVSDLFHFAILVGRNVALPFQSRGLIAPN